KPRRQREQLAGLVELQRRQPRRRRRNVPGRRRRSTALSGRRRTMNLRICSTILAAALLASPAFAASTAPPAEKTFDSAKAAVEAFVKAVEDDNLPAMYEIFGPAGKKIVASGDDVKDKNDREKFTKLVHEKIELTQDKKNPNRVTITIGNDDWPFPVPVVKTGEKWHFSTKEGLR